MGSIRFGVFEVDTRSRELLRQHVSASLSSADAEEVNQELQELGLLPYVRS